MFQVARTLMITSIPGEISDPGLITKHFQYAQPSIFKWHHSLCLILTISFYWTPFAPFASEAYPSCTVTDVRFCFDVHMLMRLDLERYSEWNGRERCSLWTVWDWCLRLIFGILQAQGNERQIVFCHKGSKGGKDLDQDSSVCSDLLLWHLWFWKGNLINTTGISVMHR